MKHAMNCMKNFVFAIKRVLRVRYSSSHKKFMDVRNTKRTRHILNFGVVHIQDQLLLKAEKDTMLPFVKAM